LFGQRSKVGDLVGQRDVTTLAQVLRGLERPIDVRVLDRVGDPEDLFVIGQRQFWTGIIAPAVAAQNGQVMLANESNDSKSLTLGVVDQWGYQISTASNIQVNRLVPHSVVGFTGPAGSYRDLQVPQPVGTSSTAFMTTRSLNSAVLTGTSVGMLLPGGGPIVMPVPLIMPQQTNFILIAQVVNIAFVAWFSGRELDLQRR
jgi:hypothetical protein